MPSPIRNSFLIAVLALSACSSQPEEPEILRPTVLETRPFDATAFTQGIEVTDDGFLVSTGQYGESSIFYLDNLQRKAEQRLEPQLFGEGSTRVGDTVWELTWRSGTAFKRDARTLEEIGRTTYEGEGWGLCSFEDAIVMSNGTEELRVLDPLTFQERERIRVEGLDGRSAKLNELACVEQQGRRKVFANVFLSTDIYRINLDSGHLDGLIDAQAIPNNAAPDPNNVLNGIANIPGSDEFWITGKRWPQMYRVRFDTTADNTH
ncbi:glutaminyl-peptide cyclotransferase [Corynebacterium gerontici]|uniref:Glutamine cyclotransferase n=1 Tax=Corynebacterium gerontici TaxID=2079234 RepID=A0A3G6IZ50_9CORY|nr:glutaminyl-peptide cyclotransferase [Corynebacterium gerontici]AZA10967.1 Glutamine cyclotransferase [Corynebacterium gerontici]